MNNRDILSYKLSLTHFQKDPSDSAAMAVFLSARKCGEQIPENVLDHLTPLIEKLYEEKHNLINKQLKIQSRSDYKAKKEREWTIFNQNQLLLQYALEEDNIELACIRFKKMFTDSPVLGSIRKRLERFLRDELTAYMKNNFSDPATASQYFPFKGTDTSTMLEIYRNIIFLKKT